MPCGEIQPRVILSLVGVLGLQSLDAGHLNVLDEGVKLVRRTDLPNGAGWVQRRGRGDMVRNGRKGQGWHVLEVPLRSDEQSCPQSMGRDKEPRSESSNHGFSSCN